MVFVQTMSDTTLSGLTKIFTILCLLIARVAANQNAEFLARQYIQEFEKKYWPQAEQIQKFLMIDLKDLTNEDIQVGELATFNIRNYTLEVYQKLEELPIDGFSDPGLKRQVRKILKLKDWLLEDRDLARKISFQPLVNKISKKPTLCSYDNRTKCDLSYDANVRDIIIKTYDPKELEFYWVQWRDHLDHNVSIPFEEYMKIIRKSAILNGFNATSDYWFDDFENGEIVQEMEYLIKQMQPLYKQLHAYMRYILRKRYGTNIITTKGPIPEHLLEKVWLEGMDKFQFHEDFDGNKSYPNLGAELVTQNYSGLGLIQESDQFYRSLGLAPLHAIFWINNSRPLSETKSNLYCRPVVYDFGQIAGLKYCSKVDFRTFLEDHAIMAKIQFHEHVKNLPYGLNTEACPGLWKVIGKAVKLSASSAKHLREIGLAHVPTDDEEMVINYLLQMVSSLNTLHSGHWTKMKIQAMAVHTVFKLPMHYVYERFYAAMLDKKVSPEEYNCYYWKLMEEWTGFEAPTSRDNDDFDVSKQFYKVTQSSLPLATYVINLRNPFFSYMLNNAINRKLLSEFSGFHLYQIICARIGQYNPRRKMVLQDCDFYNSTEAGKIISDIMTLGATLPCFEAIESFTKQRTLSANPMLEYFKPLQEWLEQKNKAVNEFLGWIPSNKCRKDD